MKNLMMKFLPLYTLVIVLVSACGGGGSGAPVVVNPNTNVPDGNDDIGIVYNGPAAATDDVAAFQTHLWENIADEDKCGGCHNPEGGVLPYFTRSDDINLAYEAANPLVDLLAPSQSRLVVKVGQGHNCFLAQASVCADTFTNFIENWATANGIADEEVIVLEAPEEREVGASLRFPADTAAFEEHLYPLLRVESGCANCHAEDGSQGQQQPYFASPANAIGSVETAYEAAKSRINLNDPANSRFITRLRDERHNCWAAPSGDNCVYSGNQMETAIENFIAALPEPAGLDPEVAAVASRAVNLIDDGTPASSGGRFESNVIALYEFKTGFGGTAFDTSGQEPLLDLDLTNNGDIQWVGSFGIRIVEGSARGNTSDSNKLVDRISRTGEYSIETWVVPANVSQDGPARIVTYSENGDNRNFTLGQTLYNYDFFSRSDLIDQSDLLSTNNDDEVLQATLQHVVVNFDPIEGRSMYVNGDLVANDPTPPGGVSEWSRNWPLVVGNEADGAEQWQGTVRLLAIHERILTEEQIQSNFDAGVGQKFFLLFGVSHLIDMEEAYVVFEVQVFDDYSYLFNAPFFISLNNEEVPAGDIVMRGMRIGINGLEASAGQAYANLDFTVNASNYNANTGVVLSNVGTVIATELGSEEDVFFLTFDQIGVNTFARSEPDVPEVPAPQSPGVQHDVGVRVFGEVNATLSSITTVPSTRVAETYAEVIQALPAEEDAQAFLASHQSGVMTLTLAYCDELANDTTLRAAFFPDFNFAGGINGTTVANIVDPLLDKMLVNPVGASSLTIDTMGDATDIATDVTELLTTNLSDRSNEVAIAAACSVVSGSALMLMQ